MGNKSDKKNRNYKQFPILNLEDSLVVLGSLIAQVTINLSKYKEYSLEINALQNKYIEINEGASEEIFIPAKEYDDINDKLLFRQRELFTALADKQAASFSYYNLREILVKHKYIDKKLEENVDKILKEFLEIRNWSFHNTQSRLVAAKESASKRLPKELSGMVAMVPQVNPVYIDCITHYDLLMAMTLAIHSMTRIEQFDLLLENMKSDYNEMYKNLTNKPFHFSNGTFTQDVIYQNIQRVSQFYHQANDTTQISMAIQKSKYDGSDEVFDKWVINKREDR